MRVLFVVCRLGNPVFMNPFIHSQGESLRAEGVDVEYFFLHGPGPLKYIVGILRLRNHLGKNAYDLIHAHYSYSGYVAVSQDEYPVVVSLMGSDVLESPPPAKRPIEKHILGRVTKKAAAIICKSQEIVDVLARNHRVYLVPNGVDLDFFKKLDRLECRETLGLSRNKRYALFPANPARREKNFALAEEAVRRLRDPSLELLVVHGEPQEKLLLYYNAADAMMLTSLYEGSPNVVKEALACGLPVISTNVGDVAQLFEDCPLGRLVEGNAQSVADALQAVLKREEKPDGCPGINKYKLQVIAGRIREIYDSVTAMKQTGNR